MNVAWIPLAAALVPFTAVQLTYVVAAAHGHVDWCFPYIDSCTSISATGREPPASFIFRALMIPSAVVMGLYWWVNAAWLEQLGARRQARALLVLGCIACVGLVLYVTVLGVDGRTWATQRRVGTVLFFSFTFLAQLLLVAGVRHSNPPPEQQRILTAMLRICLLLLSLGLLTVVLDAWDEAFYDSVEDAFEWNLSLLLQLNFLLGYLLWRRAGIALALRQ